MSVNAYPGPGMFESSSFVYIMSWPPTTASRCNFVGCPKSRARLGMDIRLLIVKYRSFLYSDTQALYHTVTCSVDVLRVHANSQGVLEAGLPRVPRGRRCELSKEG